MRLGSMMFGALALAALAPVEARAGDLLAIQVRRAETISHGTLEHAVILVEDGKIVQIGEDLPIERGIPVLDRDPEWIVMPGLVDAYSRIGLDSRGGNGSNPELRASEEIYPDTPEFREALEAGVTTLALYPAGNGIPGRAVAIRPIGDTKEDMILRDDVYLKIFFTGNSSGRKLITDGFKEADEWIEKEKKAREKYEKDKEKAEKKKRDLEKKKKEEKSDEPIEDPVEKLGPYVPPEKNPQAEAFLQLRAKELRALVRISKAADYLHLVDAIGDEEFDWDLRVPVVRELDLFHLAPEIGEAGKRVVMEPSISLHPDTMRQRNIPAELVAAGARLVLIPRSDNASGMKAWLRHTGEIVSAGLPREAALRAMTLEPAEMIGLSDRVGSIEVGKDANLLFFEGDPLEPSSKLKAVMLEGNFVHGEVKL